MPGDVLLTCRMWLRERRTREGLGRTSRHDARQPSISRRTPRLAVDPPFDWHRCPGHGGTSPRIERHWTSVKETKLVARLAVSVNTHAAPLTLCAP